MADASSVYGAHFGQGSGSILEYTYCSGSELKLIDCSITADLDYYNCLHTYDVGVRCCK